MFVVHAPVFVAVLIECGRLGYAALASELQHRNRSGECRFQLGAGERLLTPSDPAPP
jgi:hypothetical protein